MAGTTTNSYPSACAGFTMIELVFVILIIGVLSVVVGVQWPTVNMSIGAQAEQIAADIRYTQTLSMTRGQRYCFLISGSSYQIIASNTSAASALAFGNTSVILTSGITFGSVSPASMFVFDGQGTPYYSTTGSCNTANASAATALTAAATIPVVSSARTITISITPETGRVSLQ